MDKYECANPQRDRGGTGEGQGRDRGGTGEGLSLPCPCTRLFELFPFINPHLYPNRAVSAVGLAFCIIYVGP